MAYFSNYDLDDTMTSIRTTSDLIFALQARELIARRGSVFKVLEAYRDQV
jgi:hypothetical protein